jgi:hypothetical protein
MLINPDSSTLHEVHFFKFRKTSPAAAENRTKERSKRNILKMDDRLLLCFFHSQLFEHLERLAKFAEDIDWELEKRTYYQMGKNGIYQLEEIPASEYTDQKLDKFIARV